ncbi:sugar isomerase domain-containing protein [Bdellovibrionota bacterium FG-2]
MQNQKKVGVESYSEYALTHLHTLVEKNAEVLEKVKSALVEDVRVGRSLFVSGSGHSGLFSLELYHRAGGASFVVPIVADYLLPTAGPSVVRMLERTAGTSSVLLDRFGPKPGEMIWICSQSGINASVVDMALVSKSRGIKTVAFTSVAHSTAVNSRHPSGKRLFEVCDQVVDMGGRSGDALVPITPETFAGPVSTLSSILLAHSIIVAACAELEASGVRCVYTSVNTPEGEARNKELEKTAAARDYRLL